MSKVVSGSTVGGMAASGQFVSGGVAGLPASGQFMSGGPVPQAPTPSPDSPPAKPRIMLSRSLLLRLLPACLPSTTAGLAVQGALDLGDILAFCLIAAVAPAALAVAVFRWRARLLLAIAASAVAWALLLPIVARLMAGGPTESGTFLSTLTRALTDGPHRLLTTAPPAQPSAVLLMLLGTLVWWSAFWSVAAVLLDASSALVLLPPTLLVAAGTAAAVGAGNPGAMGVACVFVVISVLFLWLDQTGPTHSFASVAPALAGVTAVALLAVFAGPHLPGMNHRKPWDPRSLVNSRSDLTTDTDPLSQADAWLRDPAPGELFRVKTASHDQLLRWVVLDSYDGRRWTSTADYRPVGKSVPDPDPIDVPPGPTTDVSASVHVDRLPGPWLPAAGGVKSFSADSTLRVDSRLAMLATGDGKSVSGLDYQVTSRAQRFDDVARLTSALPGTGGALDALRSLPTGVPHSVVDWSATADVGVDSYSQLQNLAQTVSTKFRYDAKTAPGQSYGRLALLLDDAKDAAQPVGTSPDLLATLFAVAGREAGFPTRLVVGFAPSTSIGPDEYAVTAADVRIWPEAYFAKVGWVPFPGAMPAVGSSAGTGTVPVQSAPSGTPSAAAPTSQTIAPNPSKTGPLPSVLVLPPPAKKQSSAGLIAFVIGAALAVVVSCVPLTVWALRRRRRRLRRQDPDPRRRTLWAWEDAVGVLAPSDGAWRSLTPREVAAAAGATADVTRLAELSEAAVYAPEAPYPHEADEAWVCADRIRASVRRRH